MNHLHITGCRAVASGRLGPLGQCVVPGWRVSAPLALLSAALALGLAGCAGQASRDAEGGGDYRRLDPSSIPDAVPRVEPRSKYGNMASYRVRGRTYYTKSDAGGHVEYGLASWYGKQFNGRRTSSGEPYDMYDMTAAHKTLPLPSYALVTNLENGRSAVVRINDRGPFHSTRVIDLSYAAATKIGVYPKGTATVEIRGLDPARPDAAPAPAGPGAAPADTPFLAENGREADLNGTQQSAIDRSMAIAARGSAPSRRPAARSASVRERATVAAFAAVDAEPVAALTAGTEGESVAAARPAPRARRAAAAVGVSSGLYLQVGAFGDPRNAERLRERLRPHLGEEIRVQSPAGGGAELYKVRVGPLASEGEARRLSAKLAALGVSEAPRMIWN